MTKMPKRDRWRRSKLDLRSDSKCDNNVEQQPDRSEMISARDKFLKALSMSSDSDDDYDNRGSRNSLKSLDYAKLNSSKDRLDKSGDVRDKNSTHNSIQWQPATKNNIENTDSTNDKGKGKGRLTKQKTKLLEAMSVPVESDKAMRMMRLMGWQGGALGRRGEGIVEPIIPAIELVTGAGLGHSPGQGKKERKMESKKGEARTAISFRKEFLENVLDLLRKQDITEKEVIYERPLSTKEKRFTISSLEALNKRRKVGLNTTEEKDSVCRILANLNQMQNLLLTVEFSDSDRSRKIAVDKSLDDESIKTSTTDRNTVTIDDIKKTVVDLKSKKTSNAPSKAVRSHAIKLLVLSKILDFIEDKETLYVDLKFEEKMSPKQRTFFKALVNNLNKKSRFTIGGATENDLYDAIKKKADCVLKLTICQQTFRVMTIQKMYYQKRFINTANTQTKLASADADRINNSIEIDSESESICLKQQNANPVNDTDVESTNDPDLIGLDQDLAAIEQELIKEEVADRSLTPDSDVLQFDDQLESRDTSKDGNLMEDLEAIKTEDEKNCMFKMEFEDWMDDDRSALKSIDKIHIEGEEFEKNLEENDKADDVDRQIKIEENSNLVEEFVTELSPSSSKRSREDSESSDLQMSKKTKVYIDDILKVNIAIVPTTYPDQKLNSNTVKLIQTEVIESIDSMSESNYIPQLKCQGIIDGALKFVCKNYDSYLWLKKRISEVVLPDIELKLIHFTEKSKDGSRKKMMLRTRSYIKEDVRRIFSRIEKINKYLVTKEWTVLNEMWDESNGLLNVVLEMDIDSYFALEKENFSIYTGFDVGVFTEI
ncbi:hypothetical protein EVAR_100049_1 [Eumeta japonica]|uniref:G-patch domain-containing protein n=1 Tax=Eumeta variegata TaxID=151549 RepID=A0A4C1ZYU2_EUMVA|nr:hypothetical protein EVAR_100049_1 [Eumeta japonica]